MATTPEEARAARSVTGAQLALLVGGLVVLLALLWFFFLRGEPPLEAAPPPTAPVATPEPTSEPETTSKPGRGPVETFEVFAPKDPFRPAIALATGTSGVVTGDTTGTGSATEDGGAGGDGSGGGGGTGGGDTSGGTRRDESVGGHRVRLIDVFTQGGEQRARVQVDGTVYTVEEGDRFADNFELLSIEGQCASLLFGDDQFTLCEGEEILK